MLTKIVLTDSTGKETVCLVSSTDNSIETCTLHKVLTEYFKPTLGEFFTIAYILQTEYIDLRLHPDISIVIDLKGRL